MFLGGQALTIRLSVSTPCLCPAKRGRKRLDAHRPFPSITMATCKGLGETEADMRFSVTPP